MTEKQKAEEIFNKMLPRTSFIVYNAKACAIIAVDEILENIGKGGDRYDYWLSVKDHLTTL
jgi:hypothetical protein